MLMVAVVEAVVVVGIVVVAVAIVVAAAVVARAATTTRTPALVAGTLAVAVESDCLNHPFLDLDLPSHQSFVLLVFVAER